jgi:hypothetical protein
MKGRKVARSKQNNGKMTRAALGCQKSLQDRRRGRYVAYFLRHQLAIQFEAAHSGAGEVDMKRWISMCLYGAEHYWAPVPCVLSCVVDVLMIDMQF